MKGEEFEDIPPNNLLHFFVDTKLNFHIACPIKASSYHLQRTTMALKITKVSKSFGGLQVLNDINIQTRPGEILGLIGPNGAGKSTLFNLIMGYYKPNGGSILFGGKELVGLSPHRICHLGITRTFQLVKIFSSLTALENVKAGAIFGRRKRGVSGVSLDAAECLELVGLKDQMNVLASRLTFCDRRRTEVARSIAARPELLLLDEPVAGLNDSETLAMTEVIGKIRNVLDTAIFWIEHKMEAIFSLCDRVIVLNFGRKIAEGTPPEIARNKAVIEAYLGGGLEKCSS
jgi:branched-chain amino acid transport system ATP-binding protein